MSYTTTKNDTRHGGSYDRGSADAYYRRARVPHYYVDGTGTSARVEMDQMTADEISAYYEGYDDQVASGDFKEWD